MGDGGGRRSRGGQLDLHAEGAILLSLKLAGLSGGKEMGVVKVGPDESIDFLQACRGGKIFGDILGLVAPKKAQVGAGLEGDGADEEVFDGRVRPAIFPEREFGQRSIVSRLVKRVEESIAGSGSGHEDEHGWRLGREAQPFV